MKRSEVNAIITGLEKFFAKHQFMLPVWASWSPEEWKGKYDKCSEIIDNKLGWDITDFGSGDFKQGRIITFHNPKRKLGQKRQDVLREDNGI